MISAYRFLGFALAALVIVQAATHAWMSAGVNKFILDGAVIDKSFMENQSGPLPFPEILGAIIHGMNGTTLIPLVALALLVVGFLARFRRAVAYAIVIAVLVAVQIGLGMAGPALPILALLHGLNAMLIFAASLGAALAARSASVAEPLPATRTTVHATY